MSPQDTAVWQRRVAAIGADPVAQAEALQQALARLAEGMQGLQMEITRVNPTPDGDTPRYGEPAIMLGEDIGRWLDEFVERYTLLDNKDAQNEDEGLHQLAEAVAEAHGLTGRFAGIVNALATPKTESVMQKHLQPIYDAANEPFLEAALLLDNMGVENPVLHRAAERLRPPRKG